MPGRRGKNVNRTKLSTQRTARGFATRQALADAALVPLECVEKGELKGRRTNEAVITKIAAALGVNENAIR